MIAATVFIASVVGAFEAWRKWRDSKRERPSIWMGCDHGSDAYAGRQDCAAGNVVDVSTPDAGCSGGDR